MAESVEILDIDLSQLNQETEETTKTLKDLRNEVKDLRKQLEETTIGTEDFEKTLTDLTAKQKELATVTKSTNNAVAGSYDDLVNQMAELKKQWRATGDEAERSDIGGKIIALNNQLKDLDASIGNYQRNVGNYASALSNLGGTVNQTAEATQGITNSFGSCMLIMNAMGGQSDELTEAFKKMQLAMGFTKGLKDLEKGTKLFTKLGNAIKGTTAFQKLFNKEEATSVATTQALAGAMTADTAATTTATVATKAFRTALISTGIGAIVVAVGALIAGLEKLSEVFKMNNEGADKYKDTLEGLEEQFDDIENQTDRDIRLMKAKGASLDEIHARQVQQIKDEQQLLQSKMRLIQADITYVKNNRHWFDGGDKKIKQWTEEYDKLVEAYKNLNKELKELNADHAVDKQIESINRQTSAYNKAAEAAKKARQEWENYFKVRQTNQQRLNKLQQEAAALEQTARDKSYSDLVIWAQDERDALKEMYHDEVDRLKEARKQGFITEQEYRSKMMLLKTNYEAGIENITKIYQGKVRALNEKYRKEDEENRKKEHEKKVQQVKDDYNAEMKVIEAEHDELVAKYALIEDEVSAAAANEVFLKAQEEKLRAMREKLVELGEDVSEIDHQIAMNLYDQQEAFKETFAAKTATIVALTDKLSESISTLTGIGEGLSSQWSNVFSAMSTGLENITEQLNKGAEGWKKYGVMASAALNVATSMMLALADEQEEANEEGFEKQKKFQIAAATMSTLQGIVDAWVSAMNPANSWMTIWGQLAAGAAMTAMIGTMGAIQINKIKQQKYNGGSTDMSVANPSISALSKIDTGVNTTSVIQGASTEGEITDTRVYVLESDIASATNKVNVAESEATY